MNINSLEDFSLFLQNIKNNIYFSSFSLHEIISKSDDNFSTKIKNDKHWTEKSLSTFAKDFFPFEKDAENASVFLSSLGRSDKDEQVQNINMQIEYLSQRITEEKEKLKEKTRVNIAFYLFISVATVLVFI